MGDHEYSMTRFLNKLQTFVVCHYDLVMLLTFSLIIIVSKTPIISSSPKVTKNAIKHGPLFPKSSMVVDYSSGDFSLAIREQQKSDLIVVYFYAPWDSQSIKKSKAFNRVSQIFRNGITFVAINCWEPSGSCASQTYLTQFPTIALYIRGVRPVVYDGPLRVDYLAAFINRATEPYHVIYTPANLNNLFSRYDNVVAGYFNFSTGLNPPGFFQFYAASLKLLSKSITSRYTAMAVVIGEKMASEMNLTSSGRMAIFRLNSTTVYLPSKRLFHKCSEIWKIMWAYGNLQPPVVMWLQPSGMKSRLMDTALSLGPAAVLLHRHNQLTSLQHEVSKLRELALIYSTCRPLRHEPHQLHSRAVRSAELASQQRWTNACSTWRHFLRTHAPVCPRQQSQCSSAMWLQATNRCTVCDPRRVAHDFCVSPSLSCHPIRGPEVQPDDLSRRLHCNPSRRGMIRAEAARLWRQCEGPREQPGQPSERRVDDRCRFMKLAEEATPTDVEQAAPVEGLDDEATKERLEEAIGGRGCRGNRSLNFFALDRGLYPVIDHQLDANSSEQRTTLVVIDWKNEGIFSMRDNFRYDNAAKFIANFHKNKLDARRRSEENIPAAAPIPALRADLSGNMAQTLKESTKEQVVLYYAPSCGFCSMFMHKFKHLVHYFANQNSITFTRINVAENDLPWELQVENLPAIVMFPPTGSSRVPAVLNLNRHVTLGDLVSFVLRSSHSQVFLRAASQSCDQLCLSGNHERLAHHLTELQRFRSLSSKLLKTSTTRLDLLNSKLQGLLQFRHSIRDWADWGEWWRQFRAVSREFGLLDKFYKQRFHKMLEYQSKAAAVSKVVKHLNVHWRNPTALWKAIMDDAKTFGG